MLILTAADVWLALPMSEAIAAMKGAYAAYSAGQVEMPLRARLEIPGHDAASLIMPAYLNDASSEALAVKVVSLFPKNLEKGMPLIYAAVLVLEADSGRPIALVEGSALTAIRTGAASGAATDVLARAESIIAAIFGAGVQGRTQLEAIAAVREIETAWIYDPNPQRVSQFIQDMAGKAWCPNDLRAAENPQQAVSDADIICTATTSPTPVFADADLKPGVHVNGVGSYTPEMQEVPSETVRRALVVVDSRSAALTEAGDLIKPIQDDLISPDHIHTELGEILSGDKPGRSNPFQVTFFKSVGLAVQDAAAARLALSNARKMHLGQTIDF